MPSHSFKIGDHLSSPRSAYSHHGIYLGKDAVIHYAGFTSGLSKGAIEITTLDEFCQGRGVEVILHRIRKWDADQTVARAYNRLGEDWYNLLLNNCEHFVYWCIEGAHRSPQVAVAANFSMSALAYASLGRQPSRLVDPILARLGLSNEVAPSTVRAIASIVPPLASGSLAPVIAKSVTSGVLSTGARSTVGYGAAVALTAVAAPVSAPVGLVVGMVAAVSLAIKNWDDWF
ncbi:lecithin retinol acyltransferase family protein [Massilia sp. BJB1822]|uniref:lecithin retinol acyltransferase family protein n=1 Tax=Massilia sp. BJB1822 TaxID=2744470 RepID=UPI001594C523|nr:lecithin retinol acyltransferase family protein [Massilia sp. BJB1822]